MRIMEKSRLANIDRIRQTQLALRVQQRDSPKSRRHGKSVVVMPEEICPEPMTLNSCKLTRFKVVEEYNVVYPENEPCPPNQSNV